MSYAREFFSSHRPVHSFSGGPVSHSAYQMKHGGVGPFQREFFVIPRYADCVST